MKYLLIAALMTLALAAACSGVTDHAVHVVTARAPGTTCTFNDPTIYKEGGELDVTSGHGYFQIFGWENTLQPQVTTVNGDVVSDASQHTFYARQAVMTYASSDSSVTLPQATWDMAASIAAGGSSTNGSVGVELLPADLPAQLAQQVPLRSKPITLDVTFHIDGEVAGQKASTAPFTFPLTIIKTGTTCGTGQCYVPGECGVVGKDAPVTCGIPDGGGCVPIP